MSVRVPDRSLSKMEYVHNAQKLVFLIAERINKYINKVNKNNKYKHLSKSSTYSIWNAPIYHAQMVYAYCQNANDKRAFNKRLENLQMASLNLDLLESSLETFYKNFREVINDKFIELATEKIDFQNALIKGVDRQTRIVSCKPPLQP